LVSFFPHISELWIRLVTATILTCSCQESSFQEPAQLRRGKPEKLSGSSRGSVDAAQSNIFEHELEDSLKRKQKDLPVCCADEDGGGRSLKQTLPRGINREIFREFPMFCKIQAIPDDPRRPAKQSAPGMTSQRQLLSFQGD
jgi:hypothetical protein